MPDESASILGAVPQVGTAFLLLLLMLCLLLLWLLLLILLLLGSCQPRHGAAQLHGGCVALRRVSRCQKSLDGLLSCARRCSRTQRAWKRVKYITKWMAPAQGCCRRCLVGSAVGSEKVAVVD